MEHRTFRDYTRLVILTFFLSSGGVLFIRRLTYAPLSSPLTVAAVSSAFSFWFLVELYEFFSLRRRTPLRERPATGYLLFFVRILPFPAAFLADSRAMSLLLPMFFVVFAFYSAVYFGNRSSIALLLFILLVQILCELLIPDPFRPPRNREEEIDLFFLVYKVMNTLLVWLIAFFWKQDRLRWQQNQDLNANLRRTRDQLRRYAEQVAETVVLEERDRLSRDIHDSLGHTLTAASIQLTKAEAFFDRDPESARRAVSDARSCVHEGMRDIREVLGNMGEDPGADLFSRIRALVERLPRDRFDTALTLEGDQQGCNRAVLLAAYRLVQEGITNILKHSGADKAEIAVSFASGLVRVSVRDNGAGFDTAQAGTAGRGTGLQGLRDRIELVHGTFRVESSPGKGTAVEAVMPAEPSALIGWKDEGSVHER